MEHFKKEALFNHLPGHGSQFRALGPELKVGDAGGGEAICLGSEMQII